MIYSLLLSLAFVVFNMTTPLLAGLYIASDLGGNNYQTIYGVSFFCLGNILGIPFGRPFMTRLSMIQIYIICLILMGFCSLGAAIAVNYKTFIFFRFLDGLVSGPLIILITGSIIPLLLADRQADSFKLTIFIKKIKDRHQTHQFTHKWQYFLGKYLRNEPNDQTYILALTVTIFAIFSPIGGCFGAVIAYLKTWRLIFYTNTLICFFFAIFCAIKLKKYHQKPQVFIKFNRIDYMLLFFGLVLLGSALIMGQEFDWFRSFWLTWAIIIGSVCCILFVIRTWFSAQQIIELRLLKNPFFALAMVSVFFLFSIYCGDIVLLSIWLKLYVNYTPDWITALLAIMTIGAWLPLFLSYEIFDLRIALGISLIIFTVACFYTTYFNVNIDFGRIVVSRALIGIAIPLVIHSLFRMTIHSFGPEQTTACVVMFHIVRILALGLGGGLYMILWQRRQTFFNDRLGSQLTEFSQLTTQFFDRAHQFHLTQKQILAQMQVYLERQATTLALDDCYYFMTWSMIGLMIVLAVTFLWSQAKARWFVAI